MRRKSSGKSPTTACDRQVVAEFVVVDEAAIVIADLFVYSLLFIYNDIV
jgi:hypothetical protein